MKSFEMFLRLVHEMKELRRAGVGIFDEENPEWIIQHIWYEDNTREVDTYVFATEYDRNEFEGWKERPFNHGNAAISRDLERLNRYLFGLIGIGHYIYLDEDRDFYISNFYLSDDRIYFTTINQKECN